MPVTVHVIFSAHLDPIWMWPWTSGLDEALATCRSACDRLDAHPELYYTQGEAWTFSMVEQADPALFARVRAHVASGRWEVVNGWWTQPDCNFPTADGLRAQIRVGLAYVRDRFGVVPRCGFNPDSFGHCAKLPDILREHGQDRYVFMRPQEHERGLPARLFRWRSAAGTEPVTAFRIAGSYLNGLDGGIWMGPVHQCLQDLPKGCRHTLLFFGVGDHGGGPTERLVRWVKEHRDILAGARLEFSTITRFFDAVERETPDELPDVVGELQMHAIGCYTVVRETKTRLRRAEHALARAESVITETAARERLARAWRRVAAHQFHDTLGGTAIPDACRFVDDQLGGAAAEGDELVAYDVRRRLAALPDDALPRLVFANPGAAAFSGWCEGVAYTEGIWCRPWRLLDPDGREVVFQAMHSGAGNDPNWLWGLRRVLLKTDIPANGLRVVRLDVTQPPAPVVARVRVAGDGLAADGAAGVTLAPWRTVLTLGDRRVPVSLHLIDDPSDTWSHGIDRYQDGPFEEPRWAAPRALDAGPLMASIEQDGELGASRLHAEWRVYADEAWVELRLDVTWLERFKVLKLVLPLEGAAGRIDGTPGMALARANDGREMPLHDWTHLGEIAVACPDAYALDATAGRARVTLLRSPFMAHHGPCGVFPRAVVADQGVHRFRFRFHLRPPTVEALAAEALAWHRPPLVAELTRGMPARWTEFRGAGEWQV